MWAELCIAWMCGFIKALRNPGYTVSKRKGILDTVLRLVFWCVFFPYTLPRSNNMPQSFDLELLA